MSSATHTRVTLVVPAKPGRIFDLLATPHQLPAIDPSGSTISDDNDSPVTAEGQDFVMNMVAHGGGDPVAYRARHHVTAFKHNRLIAWQVRPLEDESAGSWSWRFELAPIEGKKKRTEVTLTYDWSDVSAGAVDRYRVNDHDAADLEAWLTRLAGEVRK